MLKVDFAYLGTDIKCEERQFCTISLKKSSILSDQVTL